MAQPNTPMLLSKKAQEGIVTYHKACLTNQTQVYNMRSRFRDVDLAYARENDKSLEQRRAEASNKAGDPSKFQNIEIPVVYPQVESAVTYQSSVFLTGSPIFGVVSSPQFMDAAMQMEAVIEDQSLRGGWTRELMMFFRDGFKYNFSAVEVDWVRSVSPALETDLTFSTTQGRPVETLWQGNTIKRLDPYNVFYDQSVPLTELYKKGEYAGYTEVYSRIQLKAFINALPDKMVDNVVTAFESGLGGFGSSANSVNGAYFIPEVNSEVLVEEIRPGTTNWLQWAGVTGADNKIQYKDTYEVSTLYARILPADFGLRVPAPNTPQVWKFVIVNHQILIYAERMTNAHGYIPILFAQPNEDGLRAQTKSLADNIKPFQSLTSAMWNSVIAARRRAITDRGIYDPSRIDPAHINSDNPSAKIPVRPAAYGKPIGDAYYPIPFRDDQSGAFMQEAQQLLAMANAVTGQNPVRQGQFVKGNKTRREFESVMSNANGRDQLCALLYEAQFFTPLKEIIKINILQYQGGVSLFSRAQQQMVKIDPVALRKAVLEFKISDGLTPADKLIDSDVLQVALQVIGSSPQLGQGYNVQALFSYLMKTQGADIAAFEKSKEQLAYEQAMAQWQAMVSGILESLKGVVDQAAAEEILKKLPPQPQPQQYGYNPAQQNVTPTASVSASPVSMAPTSAPVQ